jgi:hypothetical protein
MRERGKKRLVQIVILGAALLAGESAMAANHAGRVTEIVYNGISRERGACIYMVPAIPTNTSACLYRSNFLYNETTNLLLNAYLQRKICRLEWSDVDDFGFAIITTVFFR